MLNELNITLRTLLKRALNWEEGGGERTNDKGYIVIQHVTVSKHPKRKEKITLFSSFIVRKTIISFFSDKDNYKLFFILFRNLV